MEGRPFKIKSFIKSNRLLYSLYFAEACYEFAGPICASLSPSITPDFKEMLTRLQAVGNTEFDLTVSRFEPPTSRTRDERVTAQPTGQFNHFSTSQKVACKHHRGDDCFMEVSIQPFLASCSSLH